MDCCLLRVIRDQPFLMLPSLNRRGRNNKKRQTSTRIPTELQFY